MLEILDLIRKFCTGRMGAVLLGITAICSLIWFAAPVIGLADETYRFALIGLVIFIYLLGLLLRWYWAHFRGENLRKKLQAQEEQIAGRQLEIELLKEKMDAAISSLKASELGVRYRGNAALYALPWFMLIGPSASGKSTLLRNSGLHFPFASHEDLNVKGFGGTRNCDWWFATEAILLDTAGRYTTEENDRDEWYAFLELLKKYRPRLPINGIIVAMSLADLLTANNEGVMLHVKIIRERIEELYTKLGFIFPVYLVFTKIDLLRGFSGYFSDLNENDRNQIWGINLLGEETDYDKRISFFKQSLEKLYLRLAQLCLQKISMERNLRHKSEILDFPKQFSASMPKLMEFMRLLFKENPYQETPHFCGAYFTSGTQEGTPVYRLLNTSGEVFAYVEKNHEEVTAMAIETKSYFIKNFFSKVVFANTRAAGKTKQSLRLYRWLKSGAVLAGILLIVLTLMLYSASFTSNTLILWTGERVAKELADNANANNNKAMNLAALLEAGNFYQTLANYQQQVPLHLRLGLYRGETQIPVLAEMLLAEMKKQFLPSVGLATEQQLQAYAKQWQALVDPQKAEQIRGSYYILFRAYLMLCFPTRLQIDQATAPLSSIWASLNSPDNNLEAENLARYNNLVRFYLTQLQLSNDQAIAPDIAAESWHPNADLINQARQQLYLPVNAANLYSQLRSTGELALSSVSLHDLVSGEGSNLLTSKQTLPGLYTAQAWHGYVEPTIDQAVHSASQGDWVIDTALADLDKDTVPVHPSIADAEQEAQMKLEMRQLYFADYLNAWQQFLTSVEVTPFASIQEAVAELNILSDAKGPITQLLQAFAKNLNIEELNPSLINFRRIISADKKISEPLKSYFAELNKIQTDLQGLAASSDQARDAQQYAAKILAGNGNDLELYKSVLTVNMLLNSIDNGPAKAAVKSVLLQPIRESWRAVISTGTRGLDQQWKTQVYNNFQQNMANRFPFNRSASEDVPFNTMESLLQPKTGALWSFVNNYLAGYLFTDTMGWHEQQWLGVGAGFSLQFLQALSQANSLSESLFGGNNAQPGFAFQIYPEPTPGLSQIILNINGANYRYQNGPQEWQSLNWPGANLDQGSQLTAIAANGLSPETISAPGSWGLFHLLAKSQFAQVQGSTYQAHWQLKSGRHTYPVTLLFQANSANNLFQELVLQSFNLPETLF